MRLRPEQLTSQLQGGLLPLYLVSGDEPLQQGEVLDSIRQEARSQGYGEREVMHVEAGFDWTALAASADTLSLFAEKKIIELRLAGSKFGDQGTKALRAYAENPPIDTLLLISCGKLDKRQQQAKWFKALEQVGAVLQLWPVEATRLPGWIGQRARSRGLTLSAEATQLLSERVEGNLLAAAQEVEKLRLLHGEASLDLEAVEQAVGDSARYDVFELVDSALSGDAERGMRILHGLRGEGVESILVLWALAREMRALAQMAADGGDDAAMARHRVWDKRKALVRAALQRHRNPLRWQRMLARAARIDRIIKGAEPGNAWDELLQLTLLVAGIRLL